MVMIGSDWNIKPNMLLCRLSPQIPIVNFWGKYSLVILCTSNVLLQFTVLFVRHLPWNNWILFMLTVAIVMLMETIIMPFMIRFFPHITGQKNVLPVGDK